MFFYLNNGTQRALNSGPSYIDLKKTYQLSYIPKVYRNHFHTKVETEFDVTNLYSDTFDVTIPVIWNSDKLKETELYFYTRNTKAENYI